MDTKTASLASLSLIALFFISPGMAQEKPRLDCEGNRRGVFNPGTRSGSIVQVIDRDDLLATKYVFRSETVGDEACSEAKTDKVRRKLHQAFLLKKPITVVFGLNGVINSVAFKE